MTSLSRNLSTTTIVVVFHRRQPTTVRRGGKHFDRRAMIKFADNFTGGGFQNADVLILIRRHELTGQRKPTSQF